MYRAGDRFSGLDVLDRGKGQLPGCNGQGIGSVAWMHWTGNRVSGLDVLDRG
jgi:hypothetical protein